MKSQPLTPFEKVIIDALKKAPEGLTYGEMFKLKPPPPPVAKSQHNKFAVIIKDIRKKTGLEIKSMRGVGYKLA